jgi:hypothetical protein
VTKILIAMSVDNLFAGLPSAIGAIGIGGSGAPLLPCHTTGHADPHPAVRMVEVGRLSQAFPSAPGPESPIAPHHFARPRSFTPAHLREFRMGGCLAPGTIEVHGRSALPSVRPFTSSAFKALPSPAGYYGLG